MTIPLLEKNDLRGEAFSRYTIAHELGHIWDMREWFQLTFGLGLAVGTIQEVCEYQIATNTCNVTGFYYSPTSVIESAPGFGYNKNDNYASYDEFNKYAYSTIFEGWSETFASYVYPNYWSKYGGLTRQPGDDLINNGIRWKYVEKKIKELP